MLHRAERYCIIEKEEIYRRLTRLFTCQCEGGLHSTFQSDFQCLICWACSVSLERCFQIPVPVRVLFGGDSHPFIWQKSQCLYSQFSNLEYRLPWFVGDFCSPVFPLAASWPVGTHDTTGKGWGQDWKKNTALFLVYSAISP